MKNQKRKIFRFSKCRDSSLSVDYSLFPKYFPIETIIVAYIYTVEYQCEYIAVDELNI